VVEGEVVTVYHTLENSRVYHEKDSDSVEFGLEVRLVAYLARISLWSLLCVVVYFSRLPSSLKYPVMVRLNVTQRNAMNSIKF